MFFYQSQDKFRTKESELIHFGPIKNEALTAIDKFISINEKATKYLLKGAMKNVGWPWLSLLHCNNSQNLMIKFQCMTLLKNSNFKEIK